PLKFIDKKLVLSSMKGYSNNNFALKLQETLPEKATYLLEYFSVGTTKKGATIFWYLDFNGNYRKPRSIFYKPNGHRIKESEDQWRCKPSPLNFTNKDGYEYCLFGEFQLGLYPTSTTVMLVESEKTAIIGYAHFPQYIWLATGGA